jgi:nitrate reductase beta subunit
MRSVNLKEEVDPNIAAVVGMSSDEIEALYRLLAIAKYEDRYVIPSAHVEIAGQLDDLPGCSVDFDSWSPQSGQGLGGGESVPIAIQTFNLARRRANADRSADLLEDDMRKDQS